jgi:hypothetical protein
MLALVSVACMAFSQTPAAVLPTNTTASTQVTAPAVSNLTASSNPSAPQQVADLPLPVPLPVLDVRYWEGETEKYLGKNTRLNEDLDTIKMQIDHTDQSDLRDRINMAEQFIQETRAQRAKALQFIGPEFAQPLEWVALKVEQKKAEIQGELSNSLRDSAKLIAELNNQAKRKQEDIDANSRLFYFAKQQLDNARADHDRQATEKELIQVGERPGGADADLRQQFPRQASLTRRT